MRSFAWIALSLLIAAIAACGGQGRNREEAYREAAGKAVRDAVLTLEDLPSGWAPSGEETYTNFVLTGDCAQINARGAGFPGEVATVDSEPFTGPLDRELISTTSAFTDPVAAEAAVQLANDLVLRCTGQLEDALRQAIQLAAEDRNVGLLLGDIEATVEPASFPIFGDETLAYSLHADFAALFQRFEVNGHIIVIRQGALASVLAYAALGDEAADEEQSITAALAAKLVQAELSLPD